MQESSDNFVNNISFVLAKLSHKIFAAERVSKAIADIDASYILSPDTPFQPSLKVAPHHFTPPPLCKLKSLMTRNPA